MLVRLRSRARVTKSSGTVVRERMDVIGKIAIRSVRCDVLPGGLAESVGFGPRRWHSRSSGLQQRQNLFRRAVRRAVGDLVLQGERGRRPVRSLEEPRGRRLGWVVVVREVKNDPFL